MIIGNGLIGKELKRIDSDNICFFASGVSNSSEQNIKAFQREENLLKNTITLHGHSRLFIYFSSCSIYEKNHSAYTMHKIAMEKIVQNSCDKYFIFRISQASGNGGNQNSLLNNIMQKLHNNKKIQIWSNVKRNIIDVSDIVDIIYKLITNNNVYLNNINTIINIASPYNMLILEIIEIIEKYLNFKANTQLVDKGEMYIIGIDTILSFINKNDIFMQNQFEYLNKILNKYYQKGM